MHGIEKQLSNAHKHVTLYVEWVCEIGAFLAHTLAEKEEADFWRY